MEYCLGKNQKKLINTLEAIRRFSVAYNQLTEPSLRLVCLLFDAYELGKNNRLSDYLNSIHRFQSIRHYLKNSNQIPDKLVLFDEKGLFNICDGAHRVAAAIAHHLQEGDFKINIPVWIGKTSDHG